MSGAVPRNRVPTGPTVARGAKWETAGPCPPAGNLAWFWLTAGLGRRPLLQMEKWGVLHLYLVGNKHSAIHQLKAKIGSLVFTLSIDSVVHQHGQRAPRSKHPQNFHSAQIRWAACCGGARGLGVHGIEDPTTSPIQELISARDQGNLYLINSRLFSGKYAFGLLKRGLLQTTVWARVSIRLSFCPASVSKTKKQLFANRVSVSQVRMWAECQVTMVRAGDEY